MLTRTNTICGELTESAFREIIKSFKLQSADIDPSAGSTDQTSSETLTFLDGQVGDVDVVSPFNNPIVISGSSDKTSLEKFLGRPTLIDTRTWSTSDSIGYLGATLEPWYQFLNNTVIKNKLQNYAFLRGTLHLKFVLNATPFHFGLLRTAYQPNVNAADTGDRKSAIRTNTVSVNPYIVPLSQLPGSWLHPADNAGGELVIPFFKTSNWMKLNVKEPAKTMGSLYYYVTAPLGVASATGSPTLTLDTFAWLEDIHLNCSTAELTLQAKDEYDGPISKTASAVAGIAHGLEDVPIIGQFARATSIGAGAIASIASMFGFTNTPIIDGVPARIPMPGPHIASAEISAPIQKLTLDPKQELSVDPTLHGIPAGDELCIQTIVSKESALTTTTWSTTDTVGTVLFNANVGPQMFNSVSIVDGSSVQQALRVYHTPLSYVGMMFQHWRGDIIYDFDIVCTKFHKGRLKIAWDPLGSGGGSALAENTVFTTVLDIGETNRASFRVPYHQAFSWLRNRGISRVNWSTGSSLPVTDTYDNGLLLVSVLTPLMSPVSPQTVYIKVSVRAAENFEFANPKSFLGDSSTTPPPSFFAVQSKDEVDTESQVVPLGDDGVMHPHRYAMHFGEQVVSLRNLLHRMSIYDTCTPFNQAATKFSWFGKSYSKLPPMYGYDPAGLSSVNKLLVAGTAAFNCTPTHPIIYIGMMYAGMRGGINYTANIGADLYPYVGDIRVQRITDTTSAANRRGRTTSNLNTGTNSSVTSRFINNTFGSGIGGAAFTNSQTNGAVSWNYPHLAGTNFLYTDPYAAISGNANDQSDQECVFMEILVKQAAANTVTDLLTITTYAGTGVDFTCLWWLCCPTLDYYTSNPVAP